MKATARVPTKFSGNLTVLADEERREVVLRDDFGNTHRLTEECADIIRHGLFEAALLLDTVSQ